MRGIESEELPKHKLLGTYGLLVSQALVSGGALVLEIVAGRMLAPYVGMSTYTWTAVIAVVLAGLSLGHWVGGRVAEKPPRTAAAHTGIYLALGALTASATIFALRLFAAPIAGATSHPVMEITLLATAAFFLPSFFAGIPSPVIANLSIRMRPDQQGRAIGAIFAAGAIGAILGTLVSGYVLIAWLGSTATVVLVAVIYIVIALLFANAADNRKPLAICAVLAAATAIVSALAVKSLSPCTQESRYFCIRVIDVSGDVGQTSRLMVLDHLGHGISVRDDPDLLVMHYVSLLDTLVRTRLDRAPQSAFFIGGGAYTLPRAWRAAGTADITVAEIDPAVTDMAAARFWLDPSAMTIRHHDARRALNMSDNRFEVIVGDAFTDIAVPYHLVTREFFALVRSRLTSDGIYAMNFIDHVEGGQAIAAVKATLETVFANVEVFAEVEDLRAGGRTTFVLVATAAPTGIGRLRETGRQLRQFINVSDADIFKRPSDGPSLVLSDDYAPIDRLMGLHAM